MRNISDEDDKGFPSTQTPDAQDCFTVEGRGRHPLRLLLSKNQLKTTAILAFT
jgi:hypothetical protein